MQYITDVMFWISNGLLIPVVVGLVVLFLLSILILGGIFSSNQRHRRMVKKYEPLFMLVRSEGVNVLRPTLEEAHGATPFERVAWQLFDASAHERDYLIARYDLESEKSLSTPKLLTKFGPILGLMGTLIPMGPALVGLSSGDMATMAYNMQVAFATTVLGMFASGVGYLALQMLRRYRQRVLIWLDYLNDAMSHE